MNVPIPLDDLDRVIAHLQITRSILRSGYAADYRTRRERSALRDCDEALRILRSARRARIVWRNSFRKYGCNGGCRRRPVGKQQAKKERT